ncbi:MAG: tyrosine-type recombinase/integrase [Planctomycetota bacterium]|jgi:integrase
MGAASSNRLPAKPVWMTEKKVQRKNPKTGRLRRERRVLVRWKEGLRARQRSFKDPVEAARFATRKEEELLGHSQFAGRPDVLFSEWRAAYLSPRFPDYDRILAGEIGRSADKYLNLLLTGFERFEEICGDRPVRTYGAADFERFRTTLETTTKLSPVTIENQLTRVRVLFRAAADEGVIAKAPRIAVHQVHYEKEALDPKEIERIFDEARAWPPPSSRDQKRFGPLTGRIYRILATLYYSMMRRGELIHLTWNDIRTLRSGDQEILVRPKEWDEASAGGTTVKKRWEPKDREIRAIPVHPVVAEILEEQRKEGRHPLWVFTNHRGDQWSEGGLASLLHRFENATGRKLGFHLWRRSGLTHLHDAGVPPGQIQRIAGHSSLSTTMSYVSVGAEGTREAIRALKRM